ncbi:MAG: hypothetical protein GY729_02340 [Desulfobacteraceae bacterium]|nr:hypothetical protein [Desulfobacteraceae bacterium]
MITVSAITQSFEVAQTLYKTFTPLMEAMEGAGSAHVAALYGRPFLEIRSGSNIVGERNKANWDLPVASQNLSKACTILLNHWG